MIELYDIVTLENDKDYAVIKIAKINDEEYYLLNEVDPEEELLDDNLIVKKTMLDGEIALSPITSDQEFEDVKNVFANMLYEE